MEEEKTIQIKISWTEELPRKNILRAKRCVEGEQVKLVESADTRYPGRIEVRTENDDILIGYLDEDICEGLADTLEDVISPHITKIDMEEPLYVQFNYNSDYIWPTPESYCAYPFKEVDKESMAKENPSAALEMLQYAIEHEKQFTAKRVAMICYWHLKDWESRRDMAQRIINVIVSIPKDELSKFHYILYHNRIIPEMHKIMETCNKKLKPKKGRQ